MKRTQEQMQSAIGEWQQSGLNKKAFCRERSISYSTFHYWLKRLDSASTSGFAEIKVTDVRVGCEILFPSGIRMTLQGEPSATWLRELVR